MADIQVYKRVIDYVGLNAKPIPERSLALFRELNPVLALLQGMGSDGAKLVSVDSNGNLNVVIPFGSAVNIAQWAGTNVPAGLQDNADALGLTGGNYPSIAAKGYVYNGAANDRLRSASAANLAAQSGLGAALTALPGQWSINSTPAVGVQASVSRGAVASTRHVCTGFGFGFSSAVAVAATTIVINLRDGATGVGPILKSWEFSLPAAVIPNFAIEVSGVNIPGSVNTAMTMEFSALLANLLEFTNLAGYDAT
jgi:hypothetical protein